MCWIEFIAGLILGGVSGITIMALLIVSGRSEEDMEKYFNSYDCKTGELKTSR